MEDHPTVTTEMREFQEMVDYCSLTDLPSHGPLFTWCNRRDNDLISKKLDRVLVNDIWLQTYPTSNTVFESGGVSDHLRGRINVNLAATETVTKRKPFKIFNAITCMEEFKPLVDNYWANTEPIFMSSSSMLCFLKKLKNLKHHIRRLAKERMGNLVKKWKEAYENLCAKQELTLQNPSTGAMEEEREAYNRWDLISGLEEKYLKQKSKLHWLEIGDKNNKTFHRAIMTRKATNSIHEVQRTYGTSTNNEDEIKVEAEKFFREFLQAVRADFEESSIDELQALLPFRCTNTDKAMLTRDVSSEEIKRVLFAVPNDKSPGPDGYTSEFYKLTWDILGAEFVVAVQSFF